MTTACSYPPLEAGGKGDGGKGEIEILADSTAELFEGEEDEGDWNSEPEDDDDSVAKNDDGHDEGTTRRRKHW